MANKNNMCCISIDEKTKKLLDEYSKNHSISRSAGIRFIVNDFFLRRG